MISTARGGSGMRCSTFIFIRSFGTVHTSVCRLTSDHFILSVSLVRVAQRTVSSSARAAIAARRSEEHTSELQSLMRISYAVFCLKKKKKHTNALKALISSSQSYFCNIQPISHTQ